MIRGRVVALSGLAFTAAAASCALTFPDYDLEESATSSGAGGAGGEDATVSSSGGMPAEAAPDGAPCTAKEDCLSDHCLQSNTGEGKVCCASECPDMGPESCDTNGNCDAQGESCALYPAGTICGQASTCEDPGMLTSMQCQMGSCEHVLAPCPGGFVCADEDTCKAACASEVDCAHPDADCISDECMQPDGAPCDAHDHCMSKICGTTGVGHCCTAACDPTVAPCGATDCDTSGACVFPATACGESPSCMGATLTSEYCDELGACGSTPEEAPCPGHLLCDDALSCHATCGSNDSTGDALCTQGHWCDGAACQSPSGFLAPCSRGAQCASGICMVWGCW